MKKISATWGVLGLAVLLAGLAVSPVQAQTAQDALRFTQRNPASGARAIGLAGATGGGLADFSALTSNPAGLAYFQSSAFGGSLSAFSINDEAVFTGPGSITTQENDVNNTRIGHLSYVYRAPTARGSLVFSVAYQQIASFERSLLYNGTNNDNSFTDYLMPLPSEFEIFEEGDQLFPEFSRTLSFLGFETFAIDLDAGLYDDGEAVPFLPAVTAGTVDQIGSVVEEGAMQELNIGTAFEASKGVMVGFSLNVPFGTYDFFNTFNEIDAQNANDGNFDTVDFDELIFSERIESTLIGINLRAGLSAVVSRNVRVGLWAETPTYYTINEDFGTTLETFFDNGDSFAYGFDFDQTAGSGDFEYQITTPWRLGGGATAMIGKLRLLGDLEYVDWSQLELDSDTFGFDEANRTIRQQYEPVINVRLGGEYAFGDLMVRAGIAVQPDPRDTNALGATDVDVDRERAYASAGLSYLFSPNLRFDFGWMQDEINDRYRPYTEVDGAPIVDETVTRNRFVVGVTMLF